MLFFVLFLSLFPLPFSFSPPSFPFLPLPLNFWSLSLLGWLTQEKRPTHLIFYLFQFFFSYRLFVLYSIFFFKFFEGGIWIMRIMGLRAAALVCHRGGGSRKQAMGRRICTDPPPEIGSSFGKKMFVFFNLRHG